MKIFDVHKTTTVMLGRLKHENLTCKLQIAGLGSLDFGAEGLMAANLPAARLKQMQTVVTATKLAKKALQLNAKKIVREPTEEVLSKIILGGSTFVVRSKHGNSA